METPQPPIGPNNTEGQKPYSEKTPSELRTDFRETWKNSYKGEFPVSQEGQPTKDATTKVEAYEVTVDPLNPQDRRHNIQEFGLRAVAAGFEIATTIIAPTAGFLENGHQVNAITYLLKSPIEQQPVSVPLGPPRQ